MKLLNLQTISDRAFENCVLNLLPFSFYIFPYVYKH